MKKFYIVFCMILLTSVVSAQSTDRSIFGFKGEVDGAEIKAGNSSYGSYVFGDDGNLTKLFLWDGTENRSYDVSIDKRTKSSLTGQSYYGKFTATVSKNHITKVVINGEKNGYASTYTVKYTYDKNGNLTKVNEVFVYYVEESIEYGGGVYGVDRYQAEVQRIQREYQKKLMSGVAPAKALQWYENAMRKAQQGVGVNAYARTKKTKKTVKADYVYSDYEFDDFGNWVTRILEKDNNYVTQTQNIQYDPEFWSQFYWNRLQQEGNLNKIEAFYRHPITTETYKKLAAQYWNEHILDEVAQKYDNNLDTLCCVAGKTIVTNVVKEQALGIVRESMFNDVVMAENDYSRVAEMKNLQRQNVTVFNDVYKKKIEARSEQLKADSIAALTNQAQKEFDNAKYQKALAIGKNILKIDPNNKTATDLCEESCYRIISAKELDKSIQESDYVSFINDYPNSSRLQEMQNKRALFASSLFNAETPDKELERVLALSTDAPTHKIVNKRYKKWIFRRNRGKFFYAGPAIEGSYGTANALVAAELTTRYGYIANLINATVGLKYNMSFCSPHLLTSTATEETGNGFFSRSYLSVPVVLRINYTRDYKTSSYIGIGTELNCYTISSSVTGATSIKDRNFANNNLTLSPRIEWGTQALGLELELFATYDLDNLYNVEYIKNYKLDDGRSITTILDEKAYEKQVNSDQFIDKLRGGIAIRLLF